MARAVVEGKRWPNPCSSILNITTPIGPAVNVLTSLARVVHSVVHIFLPLVHFAPALALRLRFFVVATNLSERCHVELGPACRHVRMLNSPKPLETMLEV